MMIIAPRSLEYPSSGDNRPSDIPVTVNSNPEFNPSAKCILVTGSLPECLRRCGV
jgi:hypothetical protein